MHALGYCIKTTTSFIVAAHPNSDIKNHDIYHSVSTLSSLDYRHQKPEPMVESKRACVQVSCIRIRLFAIFSGRGEIQQCLWSISVCSARFVTFTRALVNYGLSQTLPAGNIWLKCWRINYNPKIPPSSFPFLPIHIIQYTSPHYSQADTMPQLPSTTEKKRQRLRVGVAVCLPFTLIHSSLNHHI